MNIVHEFQEQQPSLLNQIMSIHTENEGLNTAEHDLQHKYAVLLVLHEEAKSIFVDSLDDSFLDLSSELG